MPGACGAWYAVRCGNGQGAGAGCDSTAAHMLTRCPSASPAAPLILDVKDHAALLGTSHTYAPTRHANTHIHRQHAHTH